VSVLEEYVETLARVTIDDSVSMDPPPSGVDVADDSDEGGFFEGAIETETVPAPAGTILELSDRLRRGELTSGDLVRSIHDQAAKAHAQEAGWAYLDEASLEAALESDRRQESGTPLGPLDGIPIGVKDLIHVAGQPTGCGSQHGYPGLAEQDATCVARLRRAGAIIVGKTTTHEFAFGGTTPPTRNPWNPDRIPGGSSGGSGAVVGAGWVPAAIGTDTAGSVRIPASYCGAVGFIGSRHAVPTTGVATLAWSLDTVGPLTRSVHDAALVNAVMAGQVAGLALPPPRLPAVMGLPGSVLGPLDAGVESAFFNAIGALQVKGVATIDIAWPEEDVLQAVGFVLMMAESAEFHRTRMRASKRFDSEVEELLQLGMEIRATDYIRARRVQAHLRETILEVLDRVPVIVTPTLPCQPAPYGSGTFTPLPLGESSMALAAAHTRYPLLANVAGLPAGTVPCGLASGLPVGLQVIGGPGRDELVLSIMAGIEATLFDAGLWQVGKTAAGNRDEEGNLDDA
jgi:Asp-tRNA(Asn)/Glu-tRNA(Gln) amidotransferase A subunit family amidase